MKKLNQNGIAHIGLILVVIVIGVIGLVGYRVMSENKNSNSASGGNQKLNFEQSSIDCQPKDDNQWYRTDSTFVIDPKNPDTMYVNVEYKGFYKSTDGGNTWSKKVNGIVTDFKDNKTGENCYTEYPKAVIDPKNPKRLLLATSGSPGTLKDLNSRGGGIYETTDGGENWTQKIRDDMNAYSTPSLVLDPKNPDIYYYGTTSAPASYDEADPNKIFVEKGLIYRTKDNGGKWVELPTGFVKNARLTGIFIDPDNTDVITATTAAIDRKRQGPNAIAGEQMGIIRSSDGGKTWARIDNLPQGYEATYEGDAAPTNGKNMFVVSLTQGEKTPKSFYSTDGGVTFNQTGKYMDLARFDPNDKSGRTLVGYNWQSGMQGPPSMTLYKSTDAGKTWTNFGSLPKEITNIMDPKTRVQEIVWHPNDANTFYLTGSGGNVWKTTDNGNSWQNLLNYSKL